MRGLAEISLPRQRIARALVPVVMAGAWAPVPARAQDDGCAVIAAPVSFCGDPAVWQPFATTEGDADATFAGPDNVLSQIFVDDVGARDGVTLDSYALEIVDEQRLASSGAEFEVVGHAVEMVDGQEGRSLLLVVSKDGRQALFLMTFLVLPEQTVRFLTIAEREELYTPKAEIHVSFLDGIRIGQTDG